MKNKINKYIIALLFAAALMFPMSCSDDFLDVVNPHVLDPSVYPSDIEGFELMMTDLYGRLKGTYHSDAIRIMILISKEYDTGYDGAEFNEFTLNNLNASLALLRTPWTNMFQHIAKVNDFLVQLRKFAESDLLSNEDKERIKTMEGEARFLRAYQYFHLVNMW